MANIRKRGSSYLLVVSMGYGPALRRRAPRQSAEPSFSATARSDHQTSTRLSGARYIPSPGWIS